MSSCYLLLQNTVHRNLHFHPIVIDVFVGAEAIHPFSALRLRRSSREHRGVISEGVQALSRSMKLDHDQNADFLGPASTWRVEYNESCAQIDLPALRTVAYSSIAPVTPF